MQERMEKDYTSNAASVYQHQDDHLNPQHANKQGALPLPHLYVPNVHSYQVLPVGPLGLNPNRN